MRINISQVKSYRSNPVRWFYEFVEKRVPRASASPALAVGTAAHTFFEVLHSGSEGTVEDGLLKAGLQVSEAYARLVRTDADAALKLKKEWDTVAAILPHWSDRFKFTTLCVEQELEATLPSGRHVLYGRPDRIAVYAGKLWHVQNRTLSGSKPIAPYLRAAVLDPHELGYAWLIQQAYPPQYGEVALKDFGQVPPKFTYGGTLFNIVRKLQLMGKNGKALHEPSECFVQEFVALDPANVQRFIAGVDRMADEMASYLPEGMDPPSICSDSCRLGQYGNSLCPYFKVCAGEASLDDDQLFQDATDPYAERALAEVE